MHSNRPVVLRSRHSKYQYSTNSHLKYHAQQPGIHRRSQFDTSVHSSHCRIQRVPCKLNQHILVESEVEQHNFRSGYSMYLCCGCPIARSHCRRCAPKTHIQASSRCCLPARSSHYHSRRSLPPCRLNPHRLSHQRVRPVLLRLRSSQSA